MSQTLQIRIGLLTFISAVDGFATARWGATVFINKLIKINGIINVCQ